MQAGICNLGEASDEGLDKTLARHYKKIMTQLPENHIEPAGQWYALGRHEGVLD